MVRHFAAVRVFAVRMSAVTGKLPGWKKLLLLLL